MADANDAANAQPADDAPAAAPVEQEQVPVQ